MGHCVRHGSDGRWFDGWASFVEGPIVCSIYGHVQLNFWVVHEAGPAPLALSEDVVSVELGGRSSACTVPMAMAMAVFLQCRVLVGRFLNAGYLREYGSSPSRCGGPSGVCGGALWGIVSALLRCLALASLSPVACDTLLMGPSIPTMSTFSK